MHTKGLTYKVKNTKKNSNNTLDIECFSSLVYFLA